MDKCPICCELIVKSNRRIKDSSRIKTKEDFSYLNNRRNKKLSKSESKVVMLECGHSLHILCCAEYTRNGYNICPICRAHTDVNVCPEKPSSINQAWLACILIIALMFLLFRVLRKKL